MVVLEEEKLETRVARINSDHSRGGNRSLHSLARTNTLRNQNMQSFDIPSSVLDEESSSVTNGVQSSTGTMSTNTKNIRNMYN